MKNALRLATLSLRQEMMLLKQSEMLFCQMEISTFGENDSTMSTFIDSVRGTDIGRIDSIEQLIFTSTATGNVSLLDSASQLREQMEAELTATANSKTTLGIYINRFAADSIYIDSTEYAQLLEIAIQCPSEGGIAVYQARAMLNYFYPEMDYADYCEKLPVEFPVLRREAKINEATTSLAVFPNPARNYCTIIYSGLNDNCLFNLSDITGKLIQQFNLSDGSGSVDLNTTELVAGVYLFSATDVTGKILTGKLVLIK